MFGIRKPSDLLGWIALFFFVIASLNAVEYFFAGKNYLAKYTGEVAEVRHEIFNRTTKRRERIYSRTVIRLKEYNKSFQITDRADFGGYVPVERGDTIRMYAKRWFQHLYIYSYSSNTYYVERNGAMVYNNMGEWKGTAFAVMCFAAGLGLFLFLIYLDQSKNISLEIWFQRRVLMNKNYRK
jgi:hypothetical protein